MKILVVEDEWYAREALVKQIRQYDTEKKFEVVEAANGEEGLRLYYKECPELVMTDIRMPKMDGLQLLERVRETDKKLPVVILSAYSDFEYARTAITYGANEYLLKPIDREALTKCLDKFMKLHHQEKEEELLVGKDMITMFLANSIRKGKTAGFVETSMFEKLFPVYQIAVIFFRDGEPQQKKFPGMIRQIYGETFWMKVRFLELDEEMWLLLLRTESDTSFFWRKVRNVLEQEDMNVRIGVSGEHVHAKTVPEAYREARNVLKYKIYGKDTLLFAENTDGEFYQEYYLKANTENQLRAALTEGNEKKAVAVIENCFEEIGEIGPVKIECLELFYSQVLLSCRQVIGVEEKSRKMARFPEGILKFETILEMQEYLSRIAEEISRLKKREGGKNSGEIVEFMAEYAQKHYYEDVSVKEIAEKMLFMNQDYISHLFAERKGVNFSTFLKHVRLDRAKEFLKGGGHSVTEIASMVGYNDTSQFIRIFKQETGMTPKKFCSMPVKEECI